jgi:hypothetical protein
MVTTLKYWGAVCITALFCVSVKAKDIATYKVGDIAQTDVTTSVSFDVVNAQATAALKANKARYVPVIFRVDYPITNGIAQDFIADFDEAHSKFNSELTATFQTNINDTVIASPDFGYFVTEFNVVNKKFPVTTGLAEAWARGDADAQFRDQWLGRILQSMSRPVRADEVPAEYVFHKIRLALVKSMDQPLTFDVARKGHAVMATDVVTISDLRGQFRQEFSPDEQPVALALSQFLQPNCAPDADLTQQAREQIVGPLKAIDHYAAGQVIVRQGQTIDAPTKAALDVYAEKLVPGALNQQIAAEHQNALQQQQLAAQAQQHAQQEQQEAQNQKAAAELAQMQQQQALLERKLAENQAAQERAQAAAMRQQAFDAQNLAIKTRERNEWLVAGLATVAAVALLVMWWVIRRQRPVPISVPAKLQKMENPATAIPTELAPYLAQTLKEAVVQGLAAQRAELIHMQRLAAAEIAELVHRLDQLQTPMQERLRAYQDRIQELQKELAVRTEENRELLKMKIEMMRQQIEAEQGQQPRMKLN